MLLHYPSVCPCNGSIGDLLVFLCWRCCVCIAHVLLVCVCLFDGVRARIGYCFVFVDVVVMVVTIVLVGRIVVICVIGLVVALWFRCSCSCYFFCVVEVVVSRVCVDIPSNLFRYSKDWLFDCDLVLWVLCLVCACFVWCCALV